MIDAGYPAFGLPTSRLLPRVAGLIFLLFRWRQHDHVLALTARELEDIFISQLEVATRFDILAIQFSAIAALQIDHIWLDLPLRAPHPELVFHDLLYVPELYHGMLPAGARVLKHVVHHLVGATQQPAALLPQLDCVDYIVALENKHAPGLRWGTFARFWWLVVLEGDFGAFDAVGVLCEGAGTLEVRLLFVNRRAAVFGGCLL